MGALDEEDLYNEFDDLPDPLSWNGNEPPMELLEVENSFSVGNEGPRRPLEALAPVPSGGPAFSGPGYEQQRTQAPGFDWRRALVAAGKGDVRQYDANKLRREQGPQLDEQRRAARARLDPSSPESKAAQQEYVSAIRAMSQLPKVGAAMRDFLDSESANVGKLSAAQIERTIPRLERLAGFSLRGAHEEGVEERADQANDLKLSESTARAKKWAEERGIKWASLTEAQRHNIEMEQNKANPPVKVKLPGENTLKDFRSRQTLIDQTERAIGLLPQVRYTGAGAEGANNFLAKLPDALDVRNDAEREVAGLVNTLRAASRNKLFGAALSKYDIKDANSFLANLGNNPKTFKANLNIALMALRDMNEMAKEQYPSISGDKMPETKRPGAQGSAPTKPAKVDKVALAQKALADPKAPEKVKARAREILDAAGIRY